MWGTTKTLLLLIRLAYRQPTPLLPRTRLIASAKKSDQSSFYPQHIAVSSKSREHSSTTIRKYSLLHLERVHDVSKIDMDDQSSRDVSDRPSNGTQYPRPPVPARRPNYLLSSNVAPQETQAPTSAIRARARPPSAPFLQRHRLRRRREEEETLSYGINSVQDAVNQLQEASSNLSTLLAEPIPRIRTPDMYVDEYTGEAAVNRQRSKRRKLDIPAIRQGFRYGYRGQVVPGPLKMSIVSCDGGQLAHCMGDHQTYYRPENILRNDLSVYCTQKSETSIILRHFVETPFCLTKLVIKSPATGFTAP